MKRTLLSLTLLLLAGAGLGELCAPLASAQSRLYAQEMVPPAERPDDAKPGRPGGHRPPPGGPREGFARRRQERQQLLQFKILDRLSRMSKEERASLLSKLPPRRRETVEANLKRFQEMPPERRAALAERLRQFEQMTPQRQAHLRELIRSLAQFPRERRQMLQGEFNRMKRMSEEDRLDYTASSTFKQKFNEEERDLLADLVETAPDP